MTRVICLANSILNPSAKSGGDIIFMELALRLPAGVAVEVITSRAGHTQWQARCGEKVQYTVLPEKEPKANLTPLAISAAYIRRAWASCGILNKRTRSNDGEYDVIYTSSDFLCDVWPAAWLKLLKRKVRWVARIYHVIPAPAKREGSMISNTISFLAQRLSFFLIKRYADLILSLNPALSDELKELRFPAHLIEESGAGIDLESIRRAPVTQERSFDAVFFGRIMPQKGIFDALTIWQEVTSRNPHAQLCIIGGGAQKEVSDLREAIVHKGLSANVYYAGYVPEDEKAYGLLKAAKLYLFCDHENGWGISVAEGMACGLPVVAFDLPIFRAVHRKGCRVYPQKDTHAMAEGVLSLLEDEPLRWKIANDASLQAQEYDWPRVAGEFWSLMAKRGMLAS